MRKQGEMRCSRPCSRWDSLAPILCSHTQHLCYCVWRDRANQGTEALVSKPKKPNCPSLSSGRMNTLVSEWCPDQGGAFPVLSKPCQCLTCGGACVCYCLCSSNTNIHSYLGLVHRTGFPAQLQWSKCKGYNWRDAGFCFLNCCSQLLVSYTKRKSKGWWSCQ